ncbi:hypothetical protein [Enterovirga sp. CN4-39]|uniref:hypothetical protein n=1 Tax=Enterovirga sp. CN4-39 TaxID=3400910 RepID=UPI003BFE2757
MTMGGKRLSGEYAVRDDGRATPYAGTGRRATSGYGLIFVLGLLVAGAFLGYGMFHKGEVNEQAKPEATVGSTR